MKPTRCATAILFLLPIIAGAADTFVVQKSRSLEKLVGDMADWSNPVALPRDLRVINDVSICTSSRLKACQSMRYAMGGRHKTGYVQLRAAPRGDWFPLNREWGDRLWLQFEERAVEVDEYRFFERLDRQNLNDQVANWSQTIELPENRLNATAQFVCRLTKAPNDLSADIVAPCQVVMSRDSSGWEAKSVAFTNWEGPAELDASANWIPLNWKRGETVASVEKRSPWYRRKPPGDTKYPDSGPSYQSPDDWRPPIPGNADDPRNDRGTAPR